MYYRKDYLAAAGIKVDDLKTWEAVDAAAGKLTKKNGSEVAVYGFEPMWDNNNLQDMALSKGGKFLSDDGKTVTINSKEWVDSWENIRKAIFEDKTMRIHSVQFIDPAGGKIFDALKKAADQVEIQNVSASQALNDAQKEAQAALIEVLNK